MNKIIIVFVLCVLFTSCSYIVNGRIHHVHIRDTTGVSTAIRVVNRSGVCVYTGSVPVYLDLSKKSGYMRREKYGILFMNYNEEVVAEDSIRFVRSKSYWANLFFCNYPGLEAISKIAEVSRVMNNGRLAKEEGRVLIPSPFVASFDVQNDGLHGRPVGSGQGPALTYSGEDRDTWQEATGRSGCVQRGIVDLPDGSQMAGSSTAVSSRISRAIGISNAGVRRAYGTRCCGSWRRTSNDEGRSTSPNASSMAPSPVPKKGAPYRPD